MMFIPIPIAAPIGRDVYSDPERRFMLFSLRDYLPLDPTPNPKVNVDRYKRHFETAKATTVTQPQPQVSTASVAQPWTALLRSQDCQASLVTGIEWALEYSVVAVKGRCI